MCTLSLLQLDTVFIFLTVQNITQPYILYLVVVSPLQRVVSEGPTDTAETAPMLTTKLMASKIQVCAML